MLAAEALVDRSCGELPPASILRLAAAEVAELDPNMDLGVGIVPALGRPRIVF